MEYQEVTSSNIAAVGFEASVPVSEFGTLGIRFTSGDEYLYSDVPTTVAEALLGAESVGKAFYAMVRGKYSTLKVEEFGEDDDLEELEDD